MAKKKTREKTGEQKNSNRKKTIAKAVGFVDTVHKSLNQEQKEQIRSSLMKKTNTKWSPIGSAMMSFAGRLTTNRAREYLKE